MLWFIPIALYTWPLVVLFLFSRMVPHRALIVAVLAGVMFLPEIQMSSVSREAPDSNSFVLVILKFTKPNTVAFSALLAALVFDSARLMRFRPRWFDIPIILWCLCEFISNYLNGCPPYPSFASMRDRILTDGVPYFLGRVYFDNLENFRDLALGLVLAGLVYSPLCLYESRMFPHLHESMYGFFPGPRNEVFRWGGYRPVVFMSHGIMLGLWMVATTVVGFWLWYTGAVKEMTIWPFRRPIGMGKLMIFLGLTAVWVRSTGAIGIGCACVLGIVQLRWFRYPVLLTILLVLSPIFLYTRISGWTGDSMLAMMKEQGMPEDRIGSLWYRFHMENRLILHYHSSPDFGHGDYSRVLSFKAPKLDKDDYDFAVTDSMWIICLSCNGHYGLIFIWTTMLLPVLRFFLRYPARQWFNPVLAPGIGAALVLVMYMLDNLFNAFTNPVYVLVAGALSSLTGVKLPTRPVLEVEPEREQHETPVAEPPEAPAPRPGVLVRNRVTR